jgi:hypothetical protein
MEELPPLKEQTEHQKNLERNKDLLIGTICWGALFSFFSICSIISPVATLSTSSAVVAAVLSIPMLGAIGSFLRNPANWRSEIHFPKWLLPFYWTGYCIRRTTKLAVRIRSALTGLRQKDAEKQLQHRRLLRLQNRNSETLNDLARRNRSERTPGIISRVMSKVRKTSR